MAVMSASIRRARPLLGTFVEIVATGDSTDGVEAAVEAAFGAVATVHHLMSFHEAGSDVSRLNSDAAAHPVRVHDWTYEVLATALDLHHRAPGAFDICVAAALQRLGLLPDTSGVSTRSPRDGRPPPSPVSGAGAVCDLVELHSENHVRFADPAVKIDLGGIAKGFAVDRAVEALQRQGITDGLVNAGGDLRAFGPGSYPIDVRDPRQPGRAILRVALTNGALASSGGRFDPASSRHPHSSAVIDPATAMPAQSISGATVCASCCMIADALTKVVMNAGESAGSVLEFYGADAFFVSSLGDAHITANWKNEVHLAA
jgi:FAD:protein FMN transferase